MKRLFTSLLLLFTLSALVASQQLGGTVKVGGVVVRQAAAAGDPEYLSGFSFGADQNNYTGWLGFKFTATLGTEVITEIGRLFITGNSTTEDCVIVNFNDTNGYTEVRRVAIGSSGANGQHVYAAITSLTLNVGNNNNYSIMCHVTNGADHWYSSTTTASVTGNANLTFIEAVYTGNADPTVGVTGDTGKYGAVNFKSH